MARSRCSPRQETPSPHTEVPHGSWPRGSWPSGSWPSGSWPRAAALGLTLVTLAVYLATLAPDVVAGDGADLQTAAGSPGIAHPPGYPLYTLLGWTFSHLGDPAAWGVNLMTALCGALAAGALVLVAAELTGSWVAGLVSGAALAFSPLCWEMSLAAEVFSLNNLLAVALLGLGLSLGNDPRVGTLVLLAGTLGLGLSHHHTVVLLVPGLVLLAWPARRLLDLRTLSLSGAACAAGLLPYLYPLLRAQANPGLNWDDPRTLGGLWHLFRRADYGSLSLLPATVRGLFREASPWDQLPVYAETMLGGTNLVVSALAVVGLVWLARRHHRVAWALGLTWVVTGPGFLMYARYPLDDPFWVGIVQRFYVLPQVLVAILAGCGVALVAGRRAVPAGLTLLALVAGLGLSHYARVDRSGDTVARDYVENLLKGVPRGALLLTSGDAPGMLLEYVLYVEGRRTDLVILDQDKLTYDWYVDSKRRRHPDVSLPFRRLDGQTGTLAALVSANYGVRPILLWGFADGSLDGRYRMLPAGLAQRVAEPGEEPAPEVLAAHVETLWEAYQKRSLDRAWPPRGFNHLITSFYGFPFYSVGFEFEKAQRPEEAIASYHRALKVAPHYAPTYRRLGYLEARMGRHQAARDHLSDYLRVEPRAGDRDQVREVLQGL